MNKLKLSVQIYKKKEKPAREKRFFSLIYIKSYLIMIVYIRKIIFIISLLN